MSNAAYCRPASAVTKVDPIQAADNDYTQSFANGFSALLTLWIQEPRYLLLIALCLFLVNPTKRIAASWLLGMFLIFITGFIGRPGAFHVYHPVLALLIAVPAFTESTPRIRRYLPLFLALVLAYYHAGFSFRQIASLNNFDKTIRDDLFEPTDELIVPWPGKFPIVSIYPVLNIPEKVKLYRLDEISVFTNTPYTWQYFEKKNHRDTFARFTSSEGILMVADDYEYDLLDTYCRERLNGKLEILSEKTYGNGLIQIRRVRSVPTDNGSVY